MELKKGNYVWWDENQKETLRGRITNIIPQRDNNGEIKKTQKGINKYFLLVNDSEHKGMKISIVESQTKFFDHQRGKYGSLTHNPENNYLTFEECAEPLHVDEKTVQDSLANYLEGTSVDDDEEYLHQHHLERLLEMEARKVGELEAIRYAIRKCNE